MVKRSSMKYGVIVHRNTQNIGDELIAYAASRFLPTVDYMIDREQLDQFQSENDEPVAVIMAAWYMWNKWNWPPARCVVPKFVGVHFADHQEEEQDGSPIKFQFLEGIGGEYLNAYGPVGCMDAYTKDKLNDIGIQSYFSGNILLTLPTRKRQGEQGYILLVDVEEQVISKVNTLANKKTSVKTATQKKVKNNNDPWAMRKSSAEDFLKRLQGAELVITEKKETALACLSMEIPVLLIGETSAWKNEPYQQWIKIMSSTEFLSKQIDLDELINLSRNSDGTWKKVKLELISDIEKFISEIGEAPQDSEALYRLNYSDLEIMEWQNDVMRSCLNMWLSYHRGRFNDIERLKNELKKIKGRLK